MSENNMMQELFQALDNPWQNKTERYGQKNAFIKYSDFIYDNSNTEQSDKKVNRLAKELLIRYVLHYVFQFQYVPEVYEIKPADIFTWVKQNCSNKETVQNNFPDLIEQLYKKIMQRMENNTIHIEIVMEECTPLTNDLIKELTRRSNYSDLCRYYIKSLYIAINEADKYEFLHLDIKPENLLIGSRENFPCVLLNDFDFSAFVSYPNDETLNSCRSLPYAAPEQCGLYDNKVSRKTDVFQASLVAYMLLNEGRLPSVWDQKKIKKRKENFQKNIQPRYPNTNDKKYASAIMKGLAIDPDARASAEDILAALNAPSSSSHTEEPHSFKKIAGGALMAAALILLCVWLYPKDVPPTTENILESPEQTTLTTTAATQTTAVITTQMTTQTTAQTTETHIETTAVTTTAPPSPSGVTVIINNNNSNNNTPPVTTTPTTEMTITATTTTNFFAYAPTEFTISSYAREERISGMEITGVNGYFEGGSLVIPAQIDGVNVIAIAADAFSSLSNHITEIDFGNVRYIGNSAFENVFDGTALHLENVWFIGDCAFKNNIHLSNLYLNGNLMTVGVSAFWNDIPTHTLYVDYPNGQDAFRLTNWYENSVCNEGYWELISDILLY